MWGDAMAVHDDLRGRCLFSLLAGALYIVFGVLQVVSGAGGAGRWSELLLIGDDPIGGVMLVLVGLVFIQGYRELGRGLREGVAFVYIGIVLANLFAFIQLMEMGTNALGAGALGGDKYAGWSPVDDVAPALYLGVLSVAGLVRWRRSFTFVLLSQGNADRGRPGPVEEEQ